MENIEVIKKNNELFANALTLKIIWESRFFTLLNNSGFEPNYVQDYTKVVKKFLLDFENKVESTLEKLYK